MIFSRLTGQNISVRVDDLRRGARRSAASAKKYFSCDGNGEVTVTADDRTAVLKNFMTELVPEVCLGKREEITWPCRMQQRCSLRSPFQGAIS